MAKKIKLLFVLCFIFVGCSESLLISSQISSLTPPTIESSNESIYTNRSQLVIQGQCSPANKVKYTGFSEGFADCVDGKFSFSISLADDGVFSIHLQQIDINQILSEKKILTIVRDTIIPDGSFLNLRTDTNIKYIMPGLPISVIWSATDENLDDRPFILQFSQDNGLTFADIDKIESSRRSYSYSLPENILCLPACRFQLIIRDKAKNEKIIQSSPLTDQDPFLRGSLTDLMLRHPGEIAGLSQYQNWSTSITYAGANSNPNIYRVQLADASTMNSSGLTFYGVDLGGNLTVPYQPRGFQFIGSQLPNVATINTANFENPLSSPWTWTIAGSNKIPASNISGYGAPSPLENTSEKLILAYRSGDGMSAGGKARVQINSFALPTQKRLVFDFSLQLGTTGDLDNTWPLTGSDAENSVLLMQIKSENMLAVSSGTSNQPSLSLSVERDPVNTGKVQIFLSRCKWNPCSDSSWSTSDPAGQRYPDRLITIGNLNRGEPLDIIIDYKLDWTTNGWIKFYLNGKKYSLSSSFTPAHDIDFDQNLKTIQMQRFNMIDSANKVAITEPYRLSFGMYMYNVSSILNYSRVQHWYRARVYSE